MKNFTENNLRRQFQTGAHTGWNTGVLSKYYQGKKQLFLTRVYIPEIPAGEGPKAFDLQKEVEPRLWVVHYKGNVIAPFTGKFRFVGRGDDAIVVRFNGKIVLDWGQPDAGRLSDWSAKEQAYMYPAVKGRGAMPGDWMEVRQGESYPIEILLGERPGSAMQFVLLLEQSNVKYGTTRGGPLLPLFQIGSGKTPARGNYVPFAENGPVWQTGATGFGAWRK